MYSQCCVAPARPNGLSWSSRCCHACSLQMQVLPLEEVGSRPMARDAVARSPVGRTRSMPMQLLPLEAAAVASRCCYRARKSPVRTRRQTKDMWHTWNYGEGHMGQRKAPLHSQKHTNVCSTGHADACSDAFRHTNVCRLGAPVRAQFTAHSVSVCTVLLSIDTI